MSSKNKSIQEKTADLSKLVAWFDGDEFELELALGKYNQAEKLAEEIKKDLDILKNEINIVKQKFDSDK
jgi:exonuclease VII small subunit